MENARPADHGRRHPQAVNTAHSTIFALSSGAPPAAIAIVRVSGPQAGDALRQLAGSLPAPRSASLAALHRPRDGELLDHALVLWFPGPASATGDDVAELHLHGGRAVVAGVLGALQEVPGLRPAEPGEFTRRAFDNGRIDLNEADGLADLLSAETESQRRAALLASGGALTRLVESWRCRLLNIAAAVEAGIDYDEDVEPSEVALSQARSSALALAAEIDAMLARPPAERLRDGVRVVFAGPPNSGKSTLVNALAGREAAIASPVPGTTRDIIEVPVAIAGVPLVLIDTAGLREAMDEVEQAGVERARAAIASSDVMVWLGDGTPPAGSHVIPIYPRADERPRQAERLAVSALTGAKLAELTRVILATAGSLLPSDTDVAINIRQRAELANAGSALVASTMHDDELAVAEELRAAMYAFDRLTGRAGVDDMLAALFDRFCLGK